MAVKIRVGIMTVPERSKVLQTTLDSLMKNHEKDISLKLFEDFDHLGQPFNLTRMLRYYCTHTGKLPVLLGTDDVIYQEGWLEKISELLKKTDYQVLALFTNKNAKKVDKHGVFRAESRFAIYDQATVYRGTLFSQTFMNCFDAFASSPNRIPKEKNHYDNMLSSFLAFNGVRRGIIRPNLVKLQDVPSTLGHNIVIKDF